MDRMKARISDIMEEAPGVRTYMLEKPGEFTWAEGSHMHIGLPGFDDAENLNKNLAHPMSISTLPEEGKIGFTTRFSAAMSDFKRALSSLQTGDEISLFKIGSRMGLRRMDRPIVLLSMGVGMATVRPLIAKFLQERDRIPDLTNINVNSSGHFVFRQYLDCQKDSCYQNHWMESRSSFYQMLDRFCRLPQALYYIVGSDTFLLDVIARLLQRGNMVDDIVLDKKKDLIPYYLSGVLPPATPQPAGVASGNTAMDRSH